MTDKPSYYQRNRERILAEKKRRYQINGTEMSKRTSNHYKERVNRLASALHTLLGGRCARCNSEVSLDASNVCAYGDIMAIRAFIRKRIDCEKPILICNNCRAGD